MKWCINSTDSLQIRIHVDFFDFGLLSQLARVAQLVERQAFNLNVQGSSPCSGEYIFRSGLFSYCLLLNRFRILIIGEKVSTGNRRKKEENGE